jgi:hypothetical protein
MAEREPARAVVLSAARDYLRRWPFVISWLGLVPYGWSGIVALLPTRNLPGASLDVAHLLWASLVVPVEITIALDVLRKRPTQWSTVLKALRYVPRVSAAYLLLMIPYLVGTACGDLAQRESLRSYSDVLRAIGVVCMVGTAVACLRWIAWIPTIVDRDLGLLTSLRVARQVAQGRGAWVLRVGLWLVPPLLVAVGLTVRFPRFGHLAWSVIVPWLTLVWVAAYLELLQGTGPDRLPESGVSGTDASLDPTSR